MKPLRIIILVVLLGLGAMAVWVAGRGGGDSQQAEDKGPAAQAYNYEAEDVVLRQMGPDGRLQYQVEAQQIRQEPQSGRIAATGITLYRDPPGEPIGGPQRWTLVADQGELPPDASVILLSGNVRASGRPQQAKALLNATTERLRFDPARDEVTSDAEVALRWGGISARTNGLKVNVRTGVVEIESQFHGSFSP
jgi:LPS export ABC transporter protein LptC